MSCTPVIGIDLWEHAYFVQYEGSKESYVEQFWRHVDWEKVCSNFEKFNLEGGKVPPLLD